MIDRFGLGAQAILSGSAGPAAPHGNSEGLTTWNSSMASIVCVP